MSAGVGFITGASRGIGAAVARRMHAAGASLGLASRSGADLGLEGVVAARCDVCDPTQVEAAVAATVERFGRLDWALPALVAAGGGDFVSLASVAGVRAFPGESVYNASKFGQVGFTRALDHEMREHGVRCSVVAPGGVHTDFAIGEGREEGMPELEGMLSPEDVAEVVEFVLTRPRRMRILTTTFRPMSEGSWG